MLIPCSSRIPCTTSNKEVQDKVLSAEEKENIITCRPADRLPNELKKIEEEMKEWKQQDEDVLSYALFPQVATDFFKSRIPCTTSTAHFLCTGLCIKTVSG